MFTASATFRKAGLRIRGPRSLPCNSASDIAKEFPFSDFFHFEEITYNDRFDALRKQWRSDSQAVLAILKEGGLQDGAAVELQGRTGPGG